MSNLRRTSLNKECPLNKEVKQVEELKYGEFGRPAPFTGSNEAKFRVDSYSFVAQNNKERMTEVIQCKLPPKELNPRNFTLPCTIGNFTFYAMANLGASVNVMSRGIFEFLKLTNLRKTNMLIEMADMTKKSPLGVVEKILVEIDKFQFPSDFVITNTTPNESIILGSPFRATIHAKVNVFNREISLWDRQEQQVKKELRLDEYILVKHFCKPIVQTYNGKLNDLIWGQSYAKWYKENSYDNKPRPRDYTFREWMIVKVGHTNVNESVKKALLKSWVIDCFEEALDPKKDPMERSFDDYKWVFDLEIEQLANEYELRIGKKGHILEMIWENCKNIQGSSS
nr:hypothetical protein [Tanacetum cinerariifolium]